MLKPSVAPALALYTVSGAAGLAWQVLWVRAFQPVFGAGIESVSAVTATFLLGLGLGGALADRVGKGRSGLWRYGLLEIAVGLWGMAMPFMLGGVGHRVVDALTTTGGGVGDTAVRLAVAAALVGPPALLLGATFPAIADALSAGEHPERVGWAYGLNALGAAVGALVAGLWLPWALGLTLGSLVLGGLNLAVGATALLLTAPQSPAPSAQAKPIGRAPWVLWPLAATTGALGLSLEVTWSRLASPLLAARFEGDAGAFAGVLAAVLVGIGLGGVFGRRAGLRHPGTALGVVELSLALLTLACLEPLRDAVLPRGQFLVLEGLLPLVPAVALGASFPLLTNVLLAGDGSGRRLGRLYGLNAVCAAGGSLLTGFLILPALGAQRWAVLLAFLAACVAGAGFWIDGRRRVAVASTSLVGGLAALMLLTTAPIASHRVLLPEETLIGAVEGRLTTTLVADRGGERLLVSGGHRIASGQMAAVNDHVLRATGPASVVKTPQRALLIGLGTGETARAFLDIEGVRAVRCVEIDGNQRSLLKHFGTSSVLLEERFELVEGDGRHHLRTDDSTWDIIAVDAYGPRTASAAFYTAEFYAEARRRLAPGGALFVKFDPVSIPDPDVLDAYVLTLLDAFPVARLVHLQRGLFGLVGSETEQGLALDGITVVASSELRPAGPLTARRVTDDRPVAVPLTLEPHAEVLAPWWAAQGRREAMPWDRKRR